MLEVTLPLNLYLQHMTIIYRDTKHDHHCSHFSVSTTASAAMRIAGQTTPI